MRDICLFNTDPNYSEIKAAKSQLKTEFEIKQPKSYDNLKKVYSIWICMDVPKSEADTITKYSIKPENLFGDYSKEARYDLASLIMIRLKKENPESKNELIGMLTTLLSNNLSKEEKEKKLEDNYNIPMSVELEGRLVEMCNLSDLVEQKGIEQGIEQGINSTIRTFKKFSAGDDVVISSLIEDYNLSREKAEEYLKNFKG